MSDSEKTAIVVAGPNGAGKTTFMTSFLNRYFECDEFLNADLIAAGLSPFAPERHNLQASEIFLQQLEHLEKGNQSFAIETTLGAKSYLARIRRWKHSGYLVVLFFLWLEDSDTAVLRVKERVAQGGHNIPEADIRRRFRRGIKNLVNDYLEAVDVAFVLDARSTGYQPILCQIGSEKTVYDEAKWDQIELSLNDT